MCEIWREGLCGTFLCRTPTAGLRPAFGAALRASKFALQMDVQASRSAWMRESDLQANLAEREG